MLSLLVSYVIESHFYVALKINYASKIIEGFNLLYLNSVN